MKKETNAERMVRVMTEHDVAVELNALLFVQTVGIKKDPIAEFIAKFIFTEHNKGNYPNVSLIENTLLESPNTIRKKIKALLDFGLIKKIKKKDDSRNKYYEPTKLLKRIYLVDMTKRIKCVLELSPVFEGIMGKTINKLFSEIGTNDELSYLKTLDRNSFNEMIGNYRIDLLDNTNKFVGIKNTLKKLSSSALLIRITFHYKI